MKNSSISWTHHTFNPWRGCTKVSEGCANCYAETLSHRNPKVLGQWGPGKPRVPAAESYWRTPHAWNCAAEAAGERHRVFCASLADVFDDDGVPIAWLQRLLQLIDDTPHLDWLLLTKRPQNIFHRMQLAMNGNFDVEKTFADHMPNVWLGCTTENQQRLEERLPFFLKVAARVHFLSVEPMLGPVDLKLITPALEHDGTDGDHLTNNGIGIDWVIVGGESGSKVRPMEQVWATSLRDQCVHAGVAFHFKQWGGRDKKAAGRVLDGRTWDELPVAI